MISEKNKPKPSRGNDNFKSDGAKTPTNPKPPSMPPIKPAKEKSSK